MQVKCLVLRRCDKKSNNSGVVPHEFEYSLAMNRGRGDAVFRTRHGINSAQFSHSGFQISYVLILTELLDGLY